MQTAPQSLTQEHRTPVAPPRPARLAVLSHACFRAINRRVYGLLRERGYDVIIIAPQSMRGEPHDPAGKNDPPTHFLPLTTLSPRTYQFAGAEQVLEIHRPDVVLIDADPASLIAIRTGAWCRRNGAKLACLTAENLDFRFLPHIRRVGLRSAPQAAAKALLHARARTLVDQVFTINRSGTALYRNAGYAHVTQVPLGYDPAVFHPDPQARAKVRAELAIAPETAVLGFFGRATPQKGLHHIVEALARIEARKPARNWHLLLNEFQAGQDYAQQIKGRIDSLGLARCVTFFKATHTGIARYMAATDAVVLASLSEPTLVEQFGRVVCESMACGAVPIVSDSGEPKELVGDYGLVFPEGNVDRLTECLDAVVSEPARFRATADARARHAHERFTSAVEADIMAASLDATMRRTAP